MNPIFLQANNISVSDGLITIIFTLFVVSLVNERIIEFLKLHLPNLWLKSFRKHQEIKRQVKIRWLSLLLAIGTTLILNINLVELVVESSIEGKLNGFFDKVADYDDWIIKPLGFLLTAIFISLGSKFWHDLLDLVLFIKNKNRKIQDFNPVGIEDIQQIDSYLRENEYNIAEKALQANIERLKKEYPEGTFGIGYEYLNHEQRVCITIFDSSSEKKDIDENNQPPPTHKFLKHSLHYRTSYGYQFKFPIVLFYTGETITTVGESIAEAGGAIYHFKKKNNKGTFGCIVKDLTCNKYFLLTCYHCVILDDQFWQKFKPKDKFDKIIQYKSDFTEEIEVGSLEHGYRDNRMDIALIKPKSLKLVTDFRWRNDQTIPKGSRSVTPDDIKNRTKIWFSGKTSKISTGYIINHQYPEQVKYSHDEKKHWLNNLIVISKNPHPPYEKACNPGDSGAIIMDAQTRKALGMVVATNEVFSYAIPIDDILETNGLQMYTDPCEIIQ